MSTLSILQGKISELFSQEQPDLKYFFTKNSAGDIEVVTKGRITDYEASIVFPKSLSARLTGRGREEAGLFLSYYDTAALFPLKYNSSKDPATILDASSVVAATFAGEELQNLNDDVIITFKLGIQERTSTAGTGEFEPTANLTCVSWDFSANGKGALQESASCASQLVQCFPGFYCFLVLCRGAWQLG